MWVIISYNNVDIECEWITVYDNCPNCTLSVYGCYTKSSCNPYTKLNYNYSNNKNFPCTESRQIVIIYLILSRSKQIRSYRGEKLRGWFLKELEISWLEEESHVMSRFAHWRVIFVECFTVVEYQSNVRRKLLLRLICTWGKATC